MSGLPILVEADGLRVLVVGGGAVAGRKATALVAAGAEVRVVAPATGPAVAALVDAGRVQLARRRYEAGDVGDAELVIAATDDRATNAAVTAEARAARRLVNVADAAEEGSFSTMATHRAGALTIGISAGVPAAAARIRESVAARYDERYERALARLAQVRDRMLARGDSAGWRALSAAVMDAGFCDAVEQGTLEERLRPWA